MANEYGNYCTLTAVGEGTISEGNLKFVCAANGDVNNGTLFIPTSGKWYWELLIGAFDANNGGAGIKSIATVNSIHNLSTTGGYGMYISSNSGLNGHRFENSGTTLPGGGASQAVTFAVGDRMNIAYNADDNKLWYGKNGTFFNFETGATLTVDSSTAQFGTIIDQQYVPSVLGNAGTGGSTFTLNFGAIAFTDTPPSGYLALNTARLPEPAITNPDDHYYSGTVVTSTSSNVTTTVPFNLDDYEWLMILKNTTATGTWVWVNSFIGTGKFIRSSGNNAQGDLDWLSVSGTTFTISTAIATEDTFLVEIHKAGLKSASASNTVGSKNTTETSVNATSGFSMGVYEGNATNATIGTGLSTAYEFLAVKNLDSGEPWRNWHKDLVDGTYYLKFDSTTRQVVEAATWNSTAPAATVFSVGTVANVNGNSNTHLYFGWHGVAGYSSFESYAGKDVDGTPTNNFDGPMIYTGFTPSSILIKGLTADTNWQWSTEATNPVQGNPNTGFIVGNTTAAIVTNTTPWDFVSNGAKIRVTSDAQSITGRTYIYCMWGGTPMTDGATNQGRAK